MNGSLGRRAAVTLALLATLLLAGGCGQAHTEPPAGDAARGQALWAQSACMACHGAGAEGAKGGPALVDSPLSLHDTIALVRRGTVNMPAFSAGQIGDQDLQDIYAWWQNPSAAEGAGAGVGGDAYPAPTTAGGEGFSAVPTAAITQNPWPRSSCAGCHGQRAQGGTGPALAGEDWKFDKFQRRVREGDDGMPAFSTSLLSDADMRIIYDWLVAGAPSP